MPNDPVVLVHGYATSSARTWGDNGWLDLLAEAGRTPIAIDLLGHGTADKPHDPAAYDALEALVAAQLPDEPVDAIGFSLGARVLLTIAADTPQRFRRLVLTGVGANLLRSEGSDLIVQAIEGGGDPTNPVAQYFAGLAAHPESDPEALVACMRSARPALTPERLAAVTLPVLVVIGDRDFAGPGEPLVEALPDARLVTLRNVDHFATPKDFGAIDAALEFLDAAG
ncbi:MAG TPA: alpha/beta fold hydrolase [Acidimicrobiales bacterium]|jgi:pimeloyl-ACP methyl ester carboxylesterase|nr:alpha/beta fold hydrolase [Acidimicrobiales bacterium]